jgi:hypothetical protein
MMNRIITYSTAFVSFTVIALLILSGLIELVRNFGYLCQLWKWGFLFSPALYIYCLASINAVYLPVLGCGLLPQRIRRIKKSPLDGLASVAGILLLMVAANYLCQIFAWGSLPLIREPSGDLYMRMIPFVPWPNYPFHW